MRAASARRTSSCDAWTPANAAGLEGEAVTAGTGAAELALEPLRLGDHRLQPAELDADDREAGALAGCGAGALAASVAATAVTSWAAASTTAAAARSASTRASAAARSATTASPSASARSLVAVAILATRSARAAAGGGGERRRAPGQLGTDGQLLDRLVVSTQGVVAGVGRLRGAGGRCDLRSQLVGRALQVGAPGGVDLQRGERSPAGGHLLERIGCPGAGVGELPARPALARRPA
jgi:hypothetical protein